MNKNVKYPLCAVVLCLVCLMGCGTLGEAALQTGEASLRTVIDLLLTDFANDVADAFAGDDEDHDGDDGDDGDDGGDGNDGTDDPVARGETLVADNCAGCHGADGASGFAPDIQGVDEEAVSGAVAGDGGHTVFDALTADDVADITAYLNSFDGEGGGGGDDLVTLGEAVHGDKCAACHGADGASGFAPDIQGFGADDLAVAASGGGGHTTIELSGDEAAQIEAFLASFWLAQFTLAD